MLKFFKPCTHYTVTLKQIKYSLFASVVIILFYACQKNTSIPAVDCSGPLKSFTTDVNPVIQSTCATNSGCHGTGSNNGPGALLNYSQVFNARSAIRSAVGSGHMPPNGTLSLAEKSAIICWIDSGAQNN